MEHTHCFAAVDVKIKKQINNDSAILDINDAYCCLECSEMIEYGAIHCSSVSEIDKLEEEILECYDYLCIGDKELLLAIYNKIKINHPDISIEDMGAYICAALYNMETKEVSEERQKKRVLRLGLKPSFTNWNKKSIIHYV